jgi:tetratricopeptide (TPR) repeat protein
LLRRRRLRKDAPVPRIFISYRVKDTLQVATALCRALEECLPAGSVFLDHRSLEPAEPWPDRLRQEAAGADILIVLIGAQWLTVQDDEGIRRLDHPDDWVRQEIETAVANKRVVLPLLVDGASPLKKSAFVTAATKGIATIADLQGLSLESRRWDEDFQRLLRTLQQHGVGAVGTPERDAGGVFRSTVPTRGRAPFVGRDRFLGEIADHLENPSITQLLVVHGAAGVGKSALAREYAHVHRSRYPGGTFLVDMATSGPPVALATIGRDILGLTNTEALSIDDQCVRTLLRLAARPCLLIYDNVQTPPDVQRWLPPDGAPCHVIVTSTWERWDERWQTIRLPPMGDTDARRLVLEVAANDAAQPLVDSVVAHAGGLPAQLCPAARSLAVAIRRGEDPQVVLAEEAKSSFAGPWERLGDEAHLLLVAATFFQPTGIPRAELREALVEALGWSTASFDRALAQCLDLFVLESDGSGGLKAHQLWLSYVRQRRDSLPDTAVERVAAEVTRRFVETAKAVSSDPTNVDITSRLVRFASDVGSWISPESRQLDSDDGWHWIGLGLRTIGRFRAARPWFERAFAAKEEGARGHVDHESLGVSLHEIGHCLSQEGEYAAAQPWYERAVAAKEKGDVDGRVDHGSLGTSLHQVGFCLSAMGEYAAARPWFERAVAADEKGDVDARVDHETLGRGLHQVGFCLSATGEYAAARPWFERAVAAKEKGDVHGRVDHGSLGTSLHQVGFCLSAMGEYAAARPWFERAVAALEKGDIHGRVDHDGLGRGLHQVAFCVSQEGDYAAARPWYERAVAAKAKGDVHGRVDHESVGRSLHQVAFCLGHEGDYAAARPWYERAVAAKEKGDFYGRVDHDSLGVSLHQVGDCLGQEGDYAAARPWYEGAVAVKEKGDVHGRVDHDSLGVSLHQVGDCLCQEGDYTAARSWYERAIAAKEKGNVHGQVEAASLTVSRDALAQCRAAARKK